MIYDTHSKKGSVEPMPKWPPTSDNHNNIVNNIVCHAQVESQPDLLLMRLSRDTILHVVHLLKAACLSRNKPRSDHLYQTPKPTLPM